ncbi:hypothetical protein TNIN_98611 [Trichonephila inaurata madagascariensis]|uniref:Uncharacterized protein n=1 Tax=Trichonephila inaurata madagascariensis TaxID=2747483 RepID=A0A8X6Y374_9ARAC|nr:hypothetical protein TNIN_84811 [Trichonephila inaurata madagascariensis]GFY64587.1 hypothetical protein TNIN_98611 [Trichonephila inaurata madagascariensis]
MAPDWSIRLKRVPKDELDRTTIFDQPEELCITWNDQKAVFKAIPVVSDPCICHKNCLACVRGEELPPDCAIQALLESMVFQERMLYGQPTEARLDEFLEREEEYELCRRRT